MNIYVSNLSFNIYDEDLRELFIPFGEVISARIITNKSSGKSQGFGFVQMKDAVSATNAIVSLHRCVSGGRTLQVSEATSKGKTSASNVSRPSPFKSDSVLNYAG